MNFLKKVSKQFKSTQDWVKYLLLVLVIVIILSMFWPSNNISGVRLVPVKGTSFYQAVFENFSDDDKVKEASSNGKPAFVAFVADWCGYCKKLKPKWKEFEDSYGGKECNVLSVDCDKHKELGKKHGVSGYPTIKYLPNGLNDNEGAVDFEGERNKDGFLSFLSQYH